MKLPLLFAFVLSFTSSFAQKHSKLEIHPLTGDFYIYITHQDLDGTPFPANGMYLITKAGAVLFDTPWDTTQFQPLLDSIRVRHHTEVVMGFATHFHEDRTAGLEFLRQKGIKTFTTKQTDRLSAARGKKRAEFLITNDTAFTIGEHSFQSYYAGPGHAPDNIVFWIGKEKILYGGCLIKSVEANNLGNLSDANVKEWPSTIRNIQKKFGKPKFVIPGHQKWTDNALDHTLKLIREYQAKTN
ncbi:MAG: BlaB/IND/MUS family subclass B1 metallo-beta-lactamase [Bacteroidetes bacterium]|nr:BlaB/IND/MUS family subclass B1 metallo-beta-lactamase [Bacteroidota bacterium]